MWKIQGRITRYLGVIALAFGLVTMHFVPAALAITNKGKCPLGQFALALTDDVLHPVP